MPVGPLMVEHRLIERMIRLVKSERDNILKGNHVDLLFLEVAIDFFRIYADRCHHGKEEDILFKSLQAKALKKEHAKIMEELIQEHAFGRKTVGSLIAAKEAYSQGDKGRLKDITVDLKTLVEFYTKHIEKEDKHFFLPSMDYFTKKEQEAMLEEFWEFDRLLIHEKYKKAVIAFEKNK